MKQTQKEIKRIDWATVTWVVNNLSKKQLEAVTKMKLPAKVICDFIDREVGTGGDFKMGWDAYGNCPTAKLIYTAAGYENTGFALSARGEDWIHCMRILIYKWQEVASGRLHELAESRDAPNYG